MAVAHLSGAWIYQVLTEQYPEGVLRRTLLDHFAVLLVSSRSSRGAKGRLARRLYGRLLGLQKRGRIVQEGGIVRSLGSVRKARNPEPQLGPGLERLLFRALLAEDGQGDGHTPRMLADARMAFISVALEGGWTLAQAGAALGVDAPQAAQILGLRGVPLEKK